ncbi:IpaD/SipD/SspD family type III secretion system needle tip protein [Klebsiella sp. BIGb0407]|uniref:IpaD/SipD/SspD family type III secretion system needle tip protein n=1 Tax=Klebsiella sp. BIGb0407 TaxID=2940603 RepID=UPI0021670C4E|nr:IpaD/SipD/SspD family type III secretion system needle tip protein [Klebsiella sp. BIGb0407]MCS3431535.1 invasin D [Klebsiella sp. BIGb0407]
MSLALSDLPNYELAIPKYDTGSKNRSALKIEHAESTQDKYQSFIQDIIKVLASPKTANTINNIEDVLNQYKFSEYESDPRNNIIPDIIHDLQNIKLQPSEKKDGLNNKLNDISNSLSAIRNEIRNQTLYRKTSSEQFTASTAKLEKEFVKEGEITTGTSYAEIWLSIAIFIAHVKDDYVDFYADLMQKYTEMYESFNENVLKASSDAVSAGDDGNNVSFDTQKMQAGYDAFQKDVDRLNAELGSVEGWDKMTDDEKKRMTITLEPAYKVDNNGKISFNMDQYNSVSGSYPSGIKNGKVSTVSYNSWLVTFNAAGSAFQSNMQSFAQRYSQANNNFDTLNKIMSSAISSLADSAREVLKSLA